MLNDELLSVWLQLTNVIDNQRLAEGMPFNEALVCGLLSGGCRTASELCAETRILKSQMNAILRSLERRGLIVRRQDPEDRRRVELRLLPEGLALYRESHRQSLAIVDRLICGLGEDDTRALLPLLRRAAAIFETIHKEA